jgi:putative ABC transport system permease protein
MGKPAGRARAPSLLASIFGALARALSLRNLRSDRFGTLAAILGVGLGVATVDVILILDVNTERVEASSWESNPHLYGAPDTIKLHPLRAGGAPVEPRDAKRETHEDYEVMRSAVRLGSLSAFLVGALIVFFTFGVVVERRKREVALLRSLGALPRQVAAIFVREAVVIGAAGGLFGYLASMPMAVLGAAVGITTTGRARIPPMHLVYPRRAMALVAVVGALVALLGVIRPAREVLRLDVAKTLRPRFLEEGSDAARRARGVTLIALPFSVLVYLLLRPFFKEALPSLTFFVVEAGLVCAAFLATLVLVPDLVERVGGLLVRLVPRTPAAERLLTRRRIEHMGRELAWSVSGVMLTFALLLALHIATHGLKREVARWAESAVERYAYVIGRDERQPIASVTAALPPRYLQVHFSGRTPWPNAVHAVVSSELQRMAELTGRPDVVDMARRFGPGKMLLSRMMARRYRVGAGDVMEIEGRGGKKAFEIVGVTDDLGYTPMIGPYRNGKTYGVIDAEDFPILAPYAEPMGWAVAIADPESPRPRYGRVLAGLPQGPRYIRFDGARLKADRIVETDRDFVIFDVMLFLTSVLAAIGIANQMLLSLHGRRREIALYRVLGMTAPEVRRLVVLEGGFIGLLGGGLAVLLGVPLGFAAIGALRVVSAFEVDFDLPPSYVLLTIVGAVVVSICASLHPASRAVGGSAAESIHYE